MPYGVQLLASEAQQFERRHAVAREVAVQRARARVSRTSRVAQQHASAAAAENQRGAEAGRPAADDDDVVHHMLGGCKSSASLSW